MPGDAPFFAVLTWHSRGQGASCAAAGLVENGAGLARDGNIGRVGSIFEPNAVIMTTT
jgi:hypothetical protein